MLETVGAIIIKYSGDESVFWDFFFLLSWMSFKYIEHKQVILTYQRAQATRHSLVFGGEKKNLFD